MQSKFHLPLRSRLLLSAALFLGLAGLAPVAEAALTMNGLTFNGFTINGIRFNGTNLKSACPMDDRCEADSVATPQLQLEGSQLVLHLNR